MLPHEKMFSRCFISFWRKKSFWPLWHWIWPFSLTFKEQGLHIYTITSSSYILRMNNLQWIFFYLGDLAYDLYRSRWPSCHNVFLVFHLILETKSFLTFVTLNDLYMSRWPCCHLKTCFLNISSHFLAFVTLNMTFLTDLERSRVKNFIVLHIYTIASSYSIRMNDLQNSGTEEQLQQYFTCKHHWLTLKGHKFKIWLCCTCTL